MQNLASTGCFVKNVLVLIAIGVSRVLLTAIACFFSLQSKAHALEIFLTHLSSLLTMKHLKKEEKNKLVDGSVLLVITFYHFNTVTV